MDNGDCRWVVICCHMFISLDSMILTLLEVSGVSLVFQNLLNFSDRQTREFGFFKGQLGTVKNPSY